MVDSQVWGFVISYSVGMAKNVELAALRLASVGNVQWAVYHEKIYTVKYQMKKTEQKLCTPLFFFDFIGLYAWRFNAQTTNQRR